MGWSFRFRVGPWVYSRRLSRPRTRAAWTPQPSWVSVIRAVVALVLLAGIITFLVLVAQVS